MRLAIFLIDLLSLIYVIHLLTQNIIISLLSSSVIVLAMYAFRVFDSETLENINEQIVRTGVSLFFSVTLIISCEAVFFQNSKSIKLIVVGLIAFSTLPFLNVIAFRAVNSLKKQNPKTYLVIGRKSEIGHILDEIAKKSKNKYLFVDYINPSPAVLEQKIVAYDRVLVANYSLYKEVQDVFENHQFKKIEFLSTLAEKVLKRIPIEVIQMFQEYYELEFEKVKESPAKRIVDIIGAIAGLVFYSPLILIFSLAILIEDGKSFVFKQLRVGKDNKEFWLYKLRSMRNLVDGKAKFADQEKDRILKVGRLIRTTRIDESLQFWNILKGDMSLVGPRPEQVPFVREFQQKIPYYFYRHNVKPGLTGWAQIMYKYSSSIEETKKKLEYDLYYIKNRTMFLDLQIIFQTIETVLWKRGAK